MKNTFQKALLLALAAQLMMPAPFARAAATPEIAAIVEPRVGDQVDLTAALKAREKWYTDYKQVLFDLHDTNQAVALTAWLAAIHKESPNYMSILAKTFQPLIKNEKVLNLLGHYAYTGQSEKALDLLSFAMHANAMFLNEVAQNPRLADDIGTAVQARAANASTAALQAVKALDAKASQINFSAGVKSTEDINKLYSSTIGSSPAFTTAVEIVKSILNTRAYQGANSVVSVPGFIGGNQVRQLVQNQMDPEFIRYLAPLAEKVNFGMNQVSGKRYSEMTVEDFKSVMATKSDAINKVFTSSEGFPSSLESNSPDAHRAWLLKSPVTGELNSYGQIYQAISQAKETIFIDVFFLGGSIGASLTKKLISMVQSNPNLKVYVITDINNRLGYAREMTPVYNYLRAYAEKYPDDRILITAPQIGLKRSAFPSFVDMLISDASLKAALGTSIMQQLVGQTNFYPKGKSDHSKVVIVDGKNPDTGIAFVGSKNFTDMSGGVSYDEVTRIQGPAVLAVLDSYYHDLNEAVLLNLRDTQDANAKSYVTSLARKISPAIQLSSDETVAAAVLQPVDVLNRAGGAAAAANTRVVAKAKGSAVISIAENNVYGFTRTALTQDIAAIMDAKEQIIISDQFLFDPSVVIAIRRAVMNRALKDPQHPLKVYILLATMTDPTIDGNSFRHIPNISFIEDLKATGNIEVKWKMVPPDMLQALKDAKRNHQGIFLSPEYHLKSISVDGVSRDNSKLCGSLSNNDKVLESDNAMQALASRMTSTHPVLISGSANKDNMTMLGGFREYQVAVLDKNASIKHDCLFWSRWDDKNHSAEIDINDMNLPKELSSKGITPRLFNQMIQAVMVGAYNFYVNYL